MKILFVATEMAPLVKVGGLGDVIGSLPKELKKNGVDVSVVIPYYNTIKLGKKTPDKSYSFSFDDTKHTIELFSTEVDGVPVYLLANDKWISSFEKVAIENSQREVNHYAFFSKAVVEALGQKKIGPFSLVHLHDWHVGLVPHLFKLTYPQITPPVFLFTIHNLGYHGYSKTELIERLDLEKVNAIGDDPYFDFDARNDDQLDLLLQGLLTTDYISTVSPTYAKEIQSNEFCEGLCDLLQIRTERVFGLINGLDVESWDPGRDRDIFATYPAEPWEEGKSSDILLQKIRNGKAGNKAKLQAQLGLTEDKNVALIGFVGRLDPKQKGLDLIYQSITALLQDEKTQFQFVLLGVGESAWEHRLNSLANIAPGRISINTVFDDGLARKIYAASDLMLIPSKYEPCGLVQLIAMRYGAVPIVRATGGLKDTVIDGETGFVFKEYNAGALIDTLDRALVTFYDKKSDFTEMMVRGMSQDWSWRSSAVKYRELYEKMIG